MSRASGRRGLLLAALLLVLVLAAMDLARPDSLIRSAWQSLRGPEPLPTERALQQLRER